MLPNLASPAMQDIQVIIGKARWHIIEGNHAIKTRKQSLDRFLHLRPFSPKTQASAGLGEGRQATRHHCRALRGLRKEEEGPRKEEEVLLTCVRAWLCLPMSTSCSGRWRHGMTVAVQCRGWLLPGRHGGGPVVLPGARGRVSQCLVARGSVGSTVARAGEDDG